jgi:GT2 family glycosyltransferase
MLQSKKIFSISMVKNEMDIIESFVRYNANILDGMIILDNDSSDRTLEILRLLEKEGLPLFIFEDENRDFDQITKMNQLLKKAVEDFEADIVVPLDADEFLISTQNGNPRRLLEKIEPYAIHQAQWKTYVPTLGKNDEERFIPSKITSVRYNAEELKKLILSSEVVKDYGVILKKGNHTLSYNKKYEHLIKPIFNQELQIAHFPIRSYEQAMSKISVGWINALSDINRAKGQSWHREKMFNELKRNGKLDDEDIINFAKSYSSTTDPGKIKVKEDPMDLTFCENIALKYTDDRSNYLTDLLENSEALSLDYLNFKKDALAEIKELKSHIVEMEYFSNEGRSTKQRFISMFPSLYILLNTKKTGLKTALTNIKGYNAIKKNNLLDIGYYLETYNQVRLSGMDPILHYMYYGYKESKKPNPYFDGDYYLKTYNDVKKSNLSPLVHYALFGMAEGRKVNETSNSELLFAKKELRDKYEEILKNLDYNLHKFTDDCPCVSVIILNRDGLEHLRRLFLNFEENIQYPHYEIIVVDNASRDGSLAYLEELKNTLPLRIIKNKENQSFSQANNQAVQTAEGEYILLLNNDVEPLFGWLNHMMQVALQSPQEIGAVGAKLIYPYTANSTHNKTKSFTIQHAGIAFKHEGDHIKPYNRGNGQKPFHPSVNTQQPRAAVTAATLLLEKNKYQEVGGLDEQYHYGYEDVDLSLKLLKKGYQNIYTPQATLLHYEFGTQEKDENRKVNKRRKKNREILAQKWNEWLSQELMKDKLENNQIFTETPLKFAIKIPAPNWETVYEWGDYYMALSLKMELEKKGFEVLLQVLPEWNNASDSDCDVVMVLRGLSKYHPKKQHHNIMWNISHPDLVSVEEYNSYDHVFIASEIWAEELKSKVDVPVESLLQCADPHLFYPEPSDEFRHELLFVGNSRNVMRKIIKDLLPTDKELGIYGNRWEKFIDKKYINGVHIPNNQLHKAYSSCKILLNDHWDDMADKGFISNRLFDGFASGAFIISDEINGAREVFGDALVTYSNKEELHDLINYYLDNDPERAGKADKGRKIVLNGHTFTRRVERIINVVKEEIIK